jgi:hypothetical protein
VGARESEQTAGGLMPVPQFLRLSEATTELERAIWGGMRRPAPVAKLTHQEKKISVGWGPWTQQASEAVRSAILEHKLALYVCPEDQLSAMPAEEGTSTFSFSIPPDVFSRLLAPRGITPDRPHRSTWKTTNDDKQLLARLQKGVLILRREEFNEWLMVERAKGTWPSQSTRRKNPIGRPRRNGVTTAIRILVNEGKWNAAQSVARLRRLMIDAGREAVPSEDTIGRVVDRLFRETGEACFRRRLKSKQGPNK